MAGSTIPSPRASCPPQHQQPLERRRPRTSCDRASSRFAKSCEPLQLISRFLGCVGACDIAMDEGSSQAMLIAATTGLSAGIEAGYGIALHVDDLGSPVDPETTVRINGRAQVIDMQGDPIP